MNDHANGREPASQLEQRLSDYGPTYHHFEDNGFTVVGPDRIFIVNEASSTGPDGFTFRKIPFDSVHQFQVELGTPESRYNDADKQSPDKPVTHIRIYLTKSTVDTYVDADPREVASSLLTLNLDDTADGGGQHS